MNVVHIETAALPARAEPELELVPPAPPAERARRLLEDARAAALEHLEALRRSIEQTRTLAETVAAGPDLYTVGLQDLSRRLVEELAWRARTMDALVERQRQAAAARRPAMPQGMAS